MYNFWRAGTTGILPSWIHAAFFVFISWKKFSCGTMVLKVIRKRSKKASKAANHDKSTKATRALKARHVASICAEIESKRTSTGHIPRGEILRVFNVNKPVYTWLTMDIIKKGLKKSKDTSNGTLDTTIISDLTNSTGTSCASDAPVLIPPPLCIGFVNADKPIGRPKGTTLKHRVKSSNAWRQ
jgi:hypothetical protein